jgi:hypothetical protein
MSHLLTDAPDAPVSSPDRGYATKHQALPQHHLCLQMFETMVLRMFFDFSAPKRNTPR